MYEQSHRDYSALVICIIVCPSRAVNHYRDNAITYKAQRDKNARELKLANAAIIDMQMRQRMLLRSMQNTRRELADAKAENDAHGRRCRWPSSAAIKSSLSVSAATTPPAWIMQPPPTGRQLLNGIFHLRERLTTIKTTGRKLRSILMSSVDRSRSYQMATW